VLAVRPRNRGRFCVGSGGAVMATPQGSDEPQDAAVVLARTHPVASVDSSTVDQYQQKPAGERGDRWLFGVFLATSSTIWAAVLAVIVIWLF
jgi:hypothetical protein